jgi:BirA family biotin operon repressor/biotin-[acetyl-CoA-carboxylase] ligase
MREARGAPKSPKEWEIIEFEEVGSTNDLAEELADERVREFIVLAERQTSGRGRNRRGWYSPQGGLYFSLVLRPDFDPGAFPLLGLGMALAITKALDQLGLEAQAQVKWPNDVLVNDKKIAGILSTSKNGYVVVGVGVNVNIYDFPEDLLLLATSLAIELREMGLRDVLERILENFRPYCRLDDPEVASGLIEEYRGRSSIIGKEVEVELTDETVRGIADIDGEGRLILVQGKRRVIAAGEVSRVRCSKTKETR